MSHFDFHNEVISKSYQQAVVVDFWAPWCGPCRFIGPVLEELAKQADGKWTLVKINTDEYPDIANEYDVRGIPAIKMIYKGAVKAEFVGALPKFQVEKWLQTNLPDARQEMLEAIHNKFAQPENKEQLLGELKAFAVANPDFTPAQLELAAQIVLDEPVEAVRLIEGIKEFDARFEKAEDIRIIAQLVQFTPAPDVNAAAHLLLEAKNAAMKHDEEILIVKLIEAVQADKNFANGLARKAAIALFRTWGYEHPLTLKYRHRFDMVLY